MVQVPEVGECWLGIFLSGVPLWPFLPNETSTTPKASWWKSGGKGAKEEPISLTQFCHHLITSSSDWSFNANTPEHPAASISRSCVEAFRLLRVEPVPSWKKNPSFWKWLGSCDLQRKFILRMRQAEGIKELNSRKLLMWPLFPSFVTSLFPKAPHIPTYPNRSVSFLEKTRARKRLSVRWTIFFENLYCCLLRNLRKTFYRLQCFRSKRFL